MSERTSLKIAIACPGIGLVQRGFERLFYDLFQVMREEFDVTLFKGGGRAGDGEKTLWFARRNGPLPKLFPVHRLFGRTPMHSECMTFVLALLPHLIRGRYDIVHCIDPPLTRLLFKVRNALGLGFRILYTEGCAMPPADYPPADHMQQIAKVTHDEAVTAGIDPAYMTLLPCGVNQQRFHTSLSKAELRRKHGVDEKAFVVLSVAALNRGHKRIDYLIDEASRLDRDFLLWMDGSLDHGDADLVDLARHKLGKRCRITHVPSGSVGELYALADILVHCSVFEAFGLSMVEAAMSGLPVLAHHGPHYCWLLPNSEARIDMQREGALAERLAELIDDPGRLTGMLCRDDALQRFSWGNLKVSYRRLYEHTVRCPLRDGDILEKAS